jgi:hypothetical protein
MKRLIIIIVVFISLAFFAYSQEEADLEGAQEETPGEDVPEAEDPNNKIIEMDIKTSSLMELASWARSLGLSEGGGKEELAARLRSHYNLKAESGTVSKEAKIITIESARTTEYFTLSVVDEEYARLRGDVIISLKDGDAVHRVRAAEILYNRTRNILTASGNVEYKKEDGDTIETFKGESITVNLDNWSSLFIDGMSERSIAGNETAYRFSGTVISRNSEEVTVLTGAEITNPKNEEALWSLNASKLWLLPGSDWAILNAVLKVGNIPVLYLPFFFYPSDEIIFHPVLGYRSREGTFAQTTTYILGRPKTSGTSENSITKIFGSSADMEKKREGMFLRSTGKKYTDPNETRLSVLFDAYANLGAYLGTELALPKTGPLGALNLSFGLGLTRNIYQVSYGYSPFAQYDGSSEWNKSTLFALDVPLRYRLETGSSFSGQYGSLSWSFPFYSDPYVNRDFMDRSEELDWLSMLREGATAGDDDTAATNTTYISSYEWKLSGSLSPKITALNPYISSFSISGISSSLSFTNRNSASYSGPATQANPGRMFFMPSRLTILSANMALAGTPFTFGGGSASQVPGKAPAAPGDALLPSLPVSPWEEAEQEAAARPKAAADPVSLTPPALTKTFSAASSGGPRVAFDYRLSPTFGSEMQFGSHQSDWTEAEDIEWGDYSSILTSVRSGASMGASLSHTGGGAYSAAFRLNGTGAWQDYTYMNKDADEFNTPAARASARNRVYSQTLVTSSYDFTTSIKPFYRSSVWGATSIQYGFAGLFAKTEYDGTHVNATEDDPEWDWRLGKWDKEDLSSHSISANIAANIMDYNQTFSITTVLPPEDASLRTRATARAWISETSADMTIEDPYDDDRVFKPLTVTETLKFGTAGSFQQYVVYDPEKKEYTSLNSTFNLSGFSAIFKAAYLIPYRLNHSGSIDPAKPSGWIQVGSERLDPQELRFSYSKTFTKDKLWKNRLSFSFGINTGLAFDLQRYTYSSFNFSLNATVGIANFLDLVFSTNSENAQIYRYFQWLPFFKSDVPLPADVETNLFKDLFNSFRLDDTEKRQQSGFKLKRMNISLVHHLGDWNARLGVNLTPYLDQTGAPSSWQFKFNPEVSFLVQWVPISEIRTEMTYEKDKITFK